MKFLTLFTFATIAVLQSHAQREQFLPDHDEKPYYFGITLSGVSSRFHIHRSTRFLQQDTILVAEPLNSGGFALGLVGTLRLSPRFEARFNPQLFFGERTIQYEQRYPDIDFGLSVPKKVESLMGTFPVQLKFRSDRINNFRVYMVGGARYNLDFASNANTRRADDMIRIAKNDFGFEGGLGFSFYSQYVIISPEIKISNGLGDIHVRSPNLKYSNVLERIQSRMIMFSLHIEG